MHAFHFGGDLRTAQDETNLRAVAVTDRHIPACFDHIGNVMGGFFGGLVLVFDRLMFLSSLISELPPMAMTASFAIIDLLFSTVSLAVYCLLTVIIYAIVNAMTAFCACRRFSASSNTTEFGPSITPLVTSTSRSAGSGCM